jgi:tetratricopeptide (TPR) repeat protein
LAKDAWLGFVCPNKYPYPAKKEQPDLKKPPIESPAATLDKEREIITKELKDPYKGCQPLVKKSRFYAEIWLRIGEYHFDFDISPQGLDRAISAYLKVIPLTDNPYYDKALYKVAWAYYRADRFKEALKYFAMLVDYADSKEKETGKKGSELRKEAIQYMAISFAEEDWDNNQEPDLGEKTSIKRIKDPHLMPQDRTWTKEVYYTLGDILYDQIKYADAIHLYQLALKKWPYSSHNPKIQEKIAYAYQRSNEFEQAIREREKLSKYIRGSDWWKAQEGNPKVQREAEKLAEAALYDGAIYHHTRAQSLRQECVTKNDMNLCQRSNEEYKLAANAYRKYLELYPNTPNTYELNFNLADALFWSGHYLEAAKEYANVRDSNLDDKYLEQSAFACIKAYEKHIEELEKQRKIKVRKEPPKPQKSQEGKPRVVPIPIPEILKESDLARKKYIERVKEHERIPTFKYQIAQRYYRYGHWEEAKRRFQEIYEEYCTTHQVASFSWENLINIAGALKQLDEAKRLALLQKERQCAVTEEVRGKQKEEAIRILTSAEFREAFEIFKQAEKENDSKKYELSALSFVKAVEKAPEHEDAAKALNNAAVAYERLKRYESATKLYEKIVTDYPNSEFVDEALFRTAFNYTRFFEFENAVSRYRTLVDTRKFRKSKFRHDAILNTAILLESLQEYTTAASYFLLFAKETKDEKEAIEAFFKAGIQYEKAKNWSKMINVLKEFVRRYEGIKEAGPFIVEAWFKIANAYQKLGNHREMKNARLKCISSFGRYGLSAGSKAAEFAAQAKFLEIEDQLPLYEKMRVGGTGKKLMASVEAMASRARMLEEKYRGIKRYGSLTWTAAGLFRIGYLYERAAKTLLDTPIPPMPKTLQRIFRKAPQEEREMLQIEWEEGYRAELEKLIRPLEEKAVKAYEIAVKAAREAHIVNKWTKQALVRLNAYKPDEYPLFKEPQTHLELNVVSPPSLDTEKIKG